MPTLVWRYLPAWLYDRTSSSGVALAEALETVAHDRLTRMVQADWSGQRLRESAFRPLCMWEGGSLILDDTVIPKPLATAIESLAWVYASQERQPGDGFSLVRLIWTNGTLRIPLDLRRWRTGRPSKYELALAWLSQARHRVHGHPAQGLFDAWYPSRRLLKRMRDDGWQFVGRLKKNRRFNGQPRRAYRRHPYWAETGWLTGGLNVLVVRYGAQYCATKRLTLPAAAVRRLYRMRAQIDDVLRVGKDQLGLTGWQARAERAHLHQMLCCLVAFCGLARERQAQGLSIDKRKRHLSCQGRTVVLPALERLTPTA